MENNPINSAPAQEQPAPIPNPSAPNPTTDVNTAPPSVKNSRFSKKLLLILLALLVLIGIAGAGGYFFMNQNKTPEPIANVSPTPDPNEQVACTMDALICPDGSAVGREGPNCEFAACPASGSADTSDWKTYSDPSLGFSIKYPPNYLAKKQTNSSFPPGVQLAPGESLNNKKPLAVTYSIDIRVVNNDKKLTLSSPKEMFGNGPLISYIPELLGNTPVNKINLDNYQAYRINGCCGGQAGTEVDILTIKENKIYEILVAPYQLEGNDINKQTYEEIISTFKFTN